MLAAEFLGFLPRLPGPSWKGGLLASEAPHGPAGRAVSPQLKSGVYKCVPHMLLYVGRKACAPVQLTEGL